MGQSHSGKVLTCISCLVLGAALRDAYRLSRQNPKPLMRMIRALNIFLKEGHNEVGFLRFRDGETEGKV